MIQFQKHIKQMSLKQQLKSFWNKILDHYQISTQQQQLKQNYL